MLHHHQERASMAKTILVVEDETHLARLMQVNLEAQGYSVVTALDGKQALLTLDTVQPDLIVLDVMMPHIDGFEVLQIVRSSPDTRQIPVILLTARAQEADI